jgi:hypothetical protein
MAPHVGRVARGPLSGCVRGVPPPQQPSRRTQTCRAEEHSWPSRLTSLASPTRRPVSGPETGLPYDPVVAATDITQATTTVKCNIVFKAINRAGISGDVEASALGFIEAGDIMLIADIAERDQIDGAIEFVVRDEVWLIVATRVDAIGTVQRYLVFGRKK